MSRVDQLPGDCGICHVPDRWDVLRDDFSFDQEKETGYPLEGAHAQAACLPCHHDRGPVQVYVNRGCGGCHPDPHTASLGRDCRRCHEQTHGRPVGLVAEHARTRFPLLGAHVSAPCESCHPGAPAGQFRGAPTAWLPSTFQHAFPLRGRHDVACAQCHTGGNTSTFHCLGCHTRSETDRDHDEERGYTYNSSACYQCHPRG